jgi:hypothetical protein
MSHWLPIAAVLAEPLPVTGATSRFAARAAGVSRLPDAELLIYPSSTSAGLVVRPTSAMRTRRRRPNPWATADEAAATDRW